MAKITRALISVSDKTGIIDFARGLAGHGVEILSTGGTAKLLREAGLTIKDVSEFTGFPEMLDGRVKTLHPKVHGGLLGMRDNPEHMATWKKHDMLPIDMVVINLYPFEATIAKPDCTLADAIENIDIGGPAMLRSAGKNNNDVTVICDHREYPEILKEMQALEGNISDDTNMRLMIAAFDHTANYDRTISDYFESIYGEPVTQKLREIMQLAYGENPCQSPAFLFPGTTDDPLAMRFFDVVSGDPSFISIADGHNILNILCLLAEAFKQNYPKKEYATNLVPYIAIVGKHGNPCGAAFDWDYPAKALEKALLGYPVAVMGGELITNFPIDDALGEQILIRLKAGEETEYWGLDLILAPSYSDNAKARLSKKEKRRLMKNEALLDPTMPTIKEAVQTLRGGDQLVQQAPNFILTPAAVTTWTNTDEFKLLNADLLLAWAVAWRASSNTVALAKNSMLIGLGCGQQDRIECTRLCIDRAIRAGHEPEGSVFASDAFFPFATGDLPPAEDIINFKPENYGLEWPHPMDNAITALRKVSDIIHQLQKFDKREAAELLIDAGCVGGVVPQDGQHFKEVKTLFTEAGLKVAFIAKEFRGFSKH